MKKIEFLTAFQISKTIIFEVDYYTLSTNKTPYFSTSVFKFNQPKTDWSEGGQAQNRLLPLGVARSFWKKWNCKHLQDLTEEEYKVMLLDLGELFRKYNHITYTLKEENKPYSPTISFYLEKELSMMKLPNTKCKAERLFI